MPLLSTTTALGPGDGCPKLYYETYTDDVVEA